MTLLADKLARDFPEFTFEAGRTFEWQPSEQKIMYDPTDSYVDSHLLHELAHARLGHSTYDRDISLIGMERDAWHMAKMELGPRYDVPVTAELIDHDMDTYRDWMHERSTCPTCQSNGIEIKKQHYKCVTCLHEWDVNEARTCALRRYEAP